MRRSPRPRILKTLLKTLWILSLLTAILWPPAIFAQDTPPPPFPTGDFSALKLEGNRRITAVIDPLTVQMEDGRLFSLVGLEIPDFNPYNPGPVTQTAVRVLKDLLTGADTNIHQPGKKKDAGLTNRMGHHLAHLEKRENGAWVQGVLISLGLARVKTERRNTEMAAQMLALENKARAGNIGLWALADYKILSPEDTLGKKGSFQIVEGRVLSASMKKNRVYLNFGDNWRDDFTVTIAPEFRTNFFKNKLDPLQLNGKRIRVRGWVEDYNGPFIEIDHPERIEVLP